jgi:ribonuclease P protein component
MIQKEYRFKSWDGLIQITSKKGTPFRGENIGLKTLSLSEPAIQNHYKKMQALRPKLNKNFRPHPKYAVIVSKRVSKSAVTRNRIRRRVYEWIRLNLNSINSDQLTLIYINSDSVAKMPHQDLSLELNSIFQKAKLLSL